MEFLQRFLSFEKMIAPVLIKILYWVGIVFIVIGGLGAGGTAMAQSFLGGLLAIVVGIPLFIMLWRFYMEVILVIFGIYDRLGEIKDALAAPKT